jgi:hypothetical protein
MKKMPANTPQYVEATPVITVKDGQQLLVRVYPWYNGTATGKTICLSDLTIHGVAVDATDVSTLHDTDMEVPKVFISPDGRKHRLMQRGLNIIRMSDGTVRKVVHQ